jgi:hypothetical protein
MKTDYESLEHVSRCRLGDFVLGKAYLVSSGMALLFLLSLQG